MMCILSEKKKYYRGLWRKWKLAWAAVSRWTTAVGERTGPIDQPFGQESVAAFETVEA